MMRASTYHRSPDHFNHEERLNLYVDGELPSDEQARLFRHLADCDACRDALEAVLAFRRMSRRETLSMPPAADEAFFERLDGLRNSPERVDRSEEHRSFWRRRAPITLRSLVLAALLVFVAGSMTPLGQHARPVELAVVQPTEQAVRPLDVIYVFYPGVTIEAEPLEEQGLEDAL